MRSYVCTRDIHKRVMFANYIFANITSFAKFAKISSRENFQVHGIRSRNKMAALGYAYTLWKQTSRSPERCTIRNATSAEFLEVQIPPRVLLYVWDP